MDKKNHCTQFSLLLSVLLVLLGEGCVLAFCRMKPQAAPTIDTERLIRAVVLMVTPKN